jgi:hypothetical protein
MITTTTTLRHGLLRASKRRLISIDGSFPISSSSATAPFSTSYLHGTKASQRICSNSFTEPNLLYYYPAARQRPFGLVTDTLINQPQLGSRHSYQTSAQTQHPSIGATATLNKVEDLENSAVPHRGALSESIRSIILQDLRSVDADNNGKISSEELMALLRKHNDTFTESEILELGELFYTSLGASSVDFDRFMIAIDAAVASRGLSAGDKSDAVVPLAAKGKFRTHPLGIGTCASEYM